MQKKEQNVLQLLHICTSKLHIDLKCEFYGEENTKTSPEFVCSLYLNDFFIARGRAPNKKQARIEAHNKTVDSLLKGNFTKEPLNIKKTTASFVCDANKKAESVTAVFTTGMQRDMQEAISNPRCPGIEDLVIIEDSDSHPNQNPVFVLTRTANYNQVQLRFEFPNVQTDCAITCVVMLEDSLLAMAKGSSKQEAKLSAADAALTMLRKQAYTVRVNPEMTEEKVVSKDILKQITEGKAIEEDNVGYKLLQLMGWKKSSTQNAGAEAAKTHDSFGREGLGFSETRSITKEFISQLEKIIENYASSDTDADLVFSTEFTKEERKEIHRIAGKYALKSNSRGGQGPGRHAVLSRRFSPYELVQFLLDSGGSTTKYELVPPGVVAPD